jgi:3-oxoadipate enol-lactonase
MMPWLHQVQARSLVLTGENDGGCNPRLNRLIADALPNAGLVILPELKHAILLEAGEEVASHLIRVMQAA